MKSPDQTSVLLFVGEGLLIDRWWFIGSFTGNDGLKNIQISNTILSEPELSSCGPSSSPNVAELFVLPPKDPIRPRN